MTRYLYNIIDLSLLCVAMRPVCITVWDTYVCIALDCVDRCVQPYMAVCLGGEGATMQTK